MLTSVRGSDNLKHASHAKSTIRIHQTLRTTLPEDCTMRLMGRTAMQRPLSGKLSTEGIKYAGSAST